MRYGPEPSGGSSVVEPMSRALPSLSVLSHQAFGKTVSWPMICGNVRLPGPSNVNVMSRAPVFSAFTTWW
jgi:hypothetical protein